MLSVMGRQSASIPAKAPCIFEQFESFNQLLSSSEAGYEPCSFFVQIWTLEDWDPNKLVDGALRIGCMKHLDPQEAGNRKMRLAFYMGN
jgi:hypothetical protein